MTSAGKALAATFAVIAICLVEAGASDLPETPPLPPSRPSTLPLAPPAPPLRPEHTAQRIAAPLAANPAELCGDVIDGLIVEAEVAPPISEGVCGRDDVLAVTGLGTVRAIPLAGEARLSCAMAASLARWLGETVDQAAIRHLGSPLAALPAGVSYACRTRNHQPGAPLSEHGKVNAFDIRAFILQDGRAIPVRPIDGEDNVPHGDTADNGETAEPQSTDDTGAEADADPAPVHRPGSPEAEFQREVRAAACGAFTTVLGPGADAFHDDHLHLDMAERRSQTPYCR